MFYVNENFAKSRKCFCNRKPESKKRKKQTGLVVAKLINQQPPFGCGIVFLPLHELRPTWKGYTNLYFNIFYLQACF
jgi:hypothetical protein